MVNAKKIKKLTKTASQFTIFDKRIAKKFFSYKIKIYAMERGVNMDREEYEQELRNSASRASAYSAARTGYEMQYNELGLLNQELAEYYYIELDVHRLSVVDANVQTSGCWEGNTRDGYETEVIDDISAVVFAAYNDTIISMQEDITMKMEEISGKIEECGDKIHEELRYQLDSAMEYAKSGGK